MTEDAAVEPGPLFFDLVRFWSKRSSLNSDESISRQGRLVAIVGAVQALAQVEHVSINGLAREIGIDQSGASRLVRDAVAEGYLQVLASPDDARQRHIVLTPTGAAMLGHAREWQSSAFLSLTSDWPASEREVFAQSLHKLLIRSRKDFPI